MENITVLNNRLDESTGIVEHVLGMKAKKTPWHLRFAPKAKGIIVSFVQNLLSPLTQKEDVRGGQLSAFFQSASVVVAAVVVGIGLLASPFLVQADDGEDNAPSVLQINVQNHGSIGFDVEFDVTVPWPDIDSLFDEFQLFLDGFDGIVDDDSPRSATLISKAPNQDWLSIPGFDGGPPLPYPGYVHSFNYTVKALKAVDVILVPFSGGPPIPPPPAFWFVEYEVHKVDISLYVVLNSNGSLRSMHASAYDSDGNSYAVPVCYSP